MNPATHLKLCVNQYFMMNKQGKKFRSIKIIFHSLTKPDATVWIAIRPPALSRLTVCRMFQPPNHTKKVTPQSCNLTRLNT